ncbi:MAG: class I SAM-dependent methyltransferase [Planctomycetota bacterium]|nr:class I SAM-dependent methyltransferase [Planctomycetota bacterium]
MRPKQVLETYDEEYASSYDQRFILNPDGGLLEKTMFEAALIRKMTANSRSWLDVACGTGYFLKNARGNPHLQCAGLDLSPAMLAHARLGNPDAVFIQADFRLPQQVLEGRWDFVSCLWGAYSLQERFSDIGALVRNLATWTRSGGSCMMPVFDPRKLLRLRESNELRPGMSVSDDGTRWSLVEPSGKRHDNMLSPPVRSMETIFRRHFLSVSRYPYPPSAENEFVGLIARK